MTLLNFITVFSITPEVRRLRVLKIAYLNKQQTPKPDAHVPDAVPPFVLQSSSEKQTPLTELVSVVHSSLGNATTEKRENNLPEI